MRLAKAEIKNYRSIKWLSISFDPPCRILVGINESGKTNILNALGLLDPKRPMAQRDKREPGRDENPVTESYVRFVFTLSPVEISELTESLKSKILARNYEDPIIRIKQNDLTLEQFCKSREGLHRIDLIANARYSTTWSLGDSTIESKWKKVNSACPADFSVQTSSSEKAFPKTFVLVNTSEFPDIPKEYLEQATSEELSKLASSFISSKVESNLPKVLFWDYDEKNLLPPKVNLDQFCANPDICLPLKRMFQLYDTSDIKKAIDTAKLASANSLNNLLKRVAEKTSKHFHNTWREYEGIKFSLATDGPDLVARIEDESNNYELAQRSDGFKRFATFLLMVSAEDESNL